MRTRSCVRLFVEACESPTLSSEVESVSVQPLPARTCRCITSRADALANLPARARWRESSYDREVIGFGCGHQATKRVLLVFGPNVGRVRRRLEVPSSHPRLSRSAHHVDHTPFHHQNHRWLSRHQQPFLPRPVCQTELLRAVPGEHPPGPRRGSGHSRQWRVALPPRGAVAALGARHEQQDDLLSGLDPSEAGIAGPLEIGRRLSESKLIWNLPYGYKSDLKPL